jgi:N-acetylglutamate synthase
MTIDDYPAVMTLWTRSEGVGLTESDSREGIESFLTRNPGMSAVAVTEKGSLLGTVLCGHDGRRGYLHHLAVVPTHRKRGIASCLIAWSFDCLARRGIEKCNVFLLESNEEGANFWLHNGWNVRTDLRILQKAVKPLSPT